MEVNHHHPIYMPQYWMEVYQLILKEENCPKNCDQSQWQDLQEAMGKLIKTWNRFSKKWEVSSSDILMNKLKTVPGGTLAMLFPTDLVNNYLEFWKFYGDMVDPEKLECLDSASKETTSMSSMTALGQTLAADVSGGNTSDLGQLFAPQESLTDLFGNSLGQTGTMSSFISFVQNEEHVKFGIEEPVGEYRLAVSKCVVVSNLLFMAILLLTDQLVRWTKKLKIASQSLVQQQDHWDNDEHCSDGSSAKRKSEEPSCSFREAYEGKKPKKAGVYSIIRQTTKALILKYWTSPITSIKDVNEFRTNDLLTNPKHQLYLQAAFDDFGKDLMTLKLRDFEHILTKEGATPIFYSSNDYGTIEESTEWIDELLRFQFNDDDEQITNFLVSLVDIIDKRLSKCNGLVVCSPPSAGKNFFFDMITAILLNYGQLGQANKHNLFAFQEAPNKRLLIWNEPNYETAMTDTLKLMFGGDPYTVRVKHQQDTHVKRTPIIVLTNVSVPFMHEAAFKDRIVKFQWRAAPFLKDIDCKPYPLCLFNILNKYNIEY